MTGAPGPRVSVVIGARLSELSPDACLRAVEAQLADDVEVLVVDDADDGTGRYPDWARVAHLPGALVPQLWAHGLDLARGEVVLLTAGTLVPHGDWVARGRDALLASGGPAAVGGTFAGRPGAGLVDRSVLYCRYAAFLAPAAGAPAQERDVREVPGDNAGYLMAALQPYRDTWADGFWEPFVHARMRADGLRLSLVPGLVVDQAHGLRLRGFLSQRLRHGRVHGRRRSAGLARPVVAVAALSAPAVPPLMTARAVRAARAGGAAPRAVLTTVPLLLLCYAAWSAGELLGRVDVLRRRDG